MGSPLLDHGPRTRREREEGRKNPRTWPATSSRGLWGICLGANLCVKLLSVCIFVSRGCREVQMRGRI